MNMKKINLCLLMTLFSFGSISSAATKQDGFTVNENLPPVPQMIAAILQPGLYLGNMTGTTKSCEVVVEAKEHYASIEVKDVDAFNASTRIDSYDCLQESVKCFEFSSRRYNPLNQDIFTVRVLQSSTENLSVFSKRNLGGEGKSKLKIEKTSSGKLRVIVDENRWNKFSGYKKISCDLNN